MQSGKLIAEISTGEAWEWYGHDQGARVPAVVDVIFSPDNKVLVTVIDTNVISAWETATGKRVLRVEDVAGTSAAEVVRFSVDGSRLVVTMADHLAVFDASTGEALFSCARPPGGVSYGSGLQNPDLVNCQLIRTTMCCT